MNASETEILYWLPLIAFGAWWGIFLFLSRFGGWSVLAEIYATDEDFDGAKAQMQSVVLQRHGFPTSYNNIATIGADASALRLSLPLFFRLHHPALKIPFSDIAATTRSVLGFQRIELTASRAPGVKIVIGKTRADWIAAASHGAFRF
jgi:hypothetical protein